MSKQGPNEKLTKLRVEKYGWTKRDLSDKAGVSTQTILKAERGERISDVMKARIAKALGVKMDELFS